MAKERWNKVLVLCRGLENDHFPLHYIAPTHLKVGDMVECETRKGPIFGEIKEILAEDAYHTKENKAIKLVNKEEMSMYNNMFHTVKILRRDNGKGMLIHTSEQFLVGDLVVYQTDKANEEVEKYTTKFEQVLCEQSLRVCQNWHVGVVAEFYPAGTQVQGNVAKYAFVVSKLSTDLVFKDMSTADRAAELKMQLDARRKTFEQEQIYEMLAQSDPAAKVLWEQFKSLSMAPASNLGDDKK